MKRPFKQTPNDITQKQNNSLYSLRQKQDGGQNRRA